MNKSLLAFKLVVLAWLCAANVQAIIRYVKPGSASTAWTSKSNVYADLQAAIDAAIYGDEIWVAAGTYKPTAGTDRSISFNLKDGVSLYGGFVGSETQLTQRNWSKNKTVLSGDIGIVGTDSDNSYHVVIAEGTSLNPIGNTTRLDGVIIEKGYANYSWDDQNRGGGIYLNNASPILANVVFQKNYAISNGGALYGTNSSSVIVNTVFVGNKAVEVGGGAFLDSAIKLYHCLFFDNSSSYFGSAIYSYSNGATVDNSIVWGNISTNGDSQVHNLTYTSSCIQGGNTNNGNVNTDPMLMDAANGDYRLNSASPCIDKGLTANNPAWLLTDFAGNARLVETTVDMGPIEGGGATPFAKLPLNKAIIRSDVASVSLEWEWKNAAPADVTEYAIEVVQTPGSTYYLSTLQTKVDFLNATPGATYKWRVRGVNASSDKNWSPWSIFSVPRSHPLYVKEGGTGNGASWATAMGSVQEAIDAAVYGDEIWVASGKYKPTTTSDRTISFSLKDGVAVYGGFAGTETLLAQRNWTKNKTILSGDIGTAGVDTDNSYHVVKAVGTVMSSIGNVTRLDGVIVEKGYADDISNNQRYGGGIYLNVASPIVANVVLQKNFASNHGGGLYGTNSTSVIVNTVFTSNKSGSNGGGAYLQSAINLSHCLFINNSSTHTGGAVLSNNSATIGNSIIWGNTSFDGGSQAYNLTCTNSCVQDGNTNNGNINTDPMLMDVANGDFRLNSVSPCLDKGLNTNTPTWLLTDFAGNSRLMGASVDMGPNEGGVATPFAKLPLNKAIIKSGSTSVTLEWEWKDAVPANVTEYAIEVVQTPGSTFYLSTVQTKIDFLNATSGATYKWRVRGVNASTDKNWSSWSMFSVPRNHPLYVMEGGSGTGSSWATAMGSLQEAIDAAVYGDEVWVAKGTYKPTTSKDRTISFSLIDGVAVYGGFEGTETQLAQRNWIRNKTVLSGDIGTAGVDTDNSYHVVEAVGKVLSPISNMTRLDGVIVEKGYASDWEDNQSNGGGIYLNVASPTIANVLLQKNYASSSGGALYGANSNSVIVNTVFAGNKVGNHGGGAYLQSDIAFSHCLFVDNSSAYIGGAIFGSGNSASLSNSIIWGNSSLNGGSQAYNLTWINSCVQDGNTNNGNIITDPMLMDAANGDYRLNSSSPCIDKGLNTNAPSWLLTDFTGNARLVGTNVDMGPFEGGVATPLAKLPLNNAIIKPGDTSVSLEWEWKDAVPTDVTEYAIEVVQTPGSTFYLSTLQTKIDFLNATPGAVYKWRVRGVNASTEKNWSPWSMFSVPNNHPFYVKEGGTGTGSSWGTAMGSLQEAIDAAVYGDEVWVAKGTYKPTSGSDRSISFNLKNGVAIYGGFVGNETKSEQRDWAKNPTILSGDIGVVDTDTDNTYNVVKAIGTLTAPLDTTTRLDGLIIEKGYSDNDGGGAILKYANIIIANNVFRNNYTSDDGGAVYATSSNSTFANNLFLSNKANDDGGAVYTESALTFTHCTFALNRSEYSGGAVYNSNVGSAISNCIAWGNRAKNYYQQLHGVICTYSCVEGGYTGTGNISNDPLFVDAANGNYRLQQASPCINKALATRTPAWLTSDFDLLPRSINGGVDMGAYEAAYVASMTPADNGVHTQKSGFGSYLKWDLDKTLSETTKQSIKCDFELWKNGVPGTIIAKGSGKALENLWIMPVDFSTTYQWRVGVQTAGHTYWSTPATFYIGRENPIYVKTNGTGDGSSWVNALGSVSSALELANAGDRIWVAAGTYKPTGAGRDAAFKMKPFVELLGGFVETDNLGTERNPELNVTILSGDLGTVNNDSDNAYHVINNAYSEGSPLIGAVIDGFTITGGNAGSANGGGMLNTYANPMVRYCKFIGNKAASGGAIANVSSSPAVVNSLLVKNTASSKGGAIYSDASSAPAIVNSTIANNIATTGGGITGSGTVGNTIVYGNTGGQIEGTPTVTYSCVQGGFTGTANINASPRFKDADNGNYAIGSFSSCFDKGNSELITTDFARYDLSFGEMRNFVSSVDIGAYELRYPDIAARVEVTQATPANAAIDIDYSVPIVLTFNEPATISDTLGITMASGIAFKSISLSDNKKTLTLTPDINWPFNSSQKVVIANGAIVSADNSNFRMVDYECGFDIRSCLPATLSIELLKPETCPGTLAQLTAKTTGDVQDYQWLFNQTVVANDTSAFTIQKLTADSIGVYHCNVIDMCGNTVSAQSTVKFVDGVLNPVIVKKWNDVYLVDNSSKRFSDYQWYFNGTSNSLTSQYITLGSLSTGQTLYVTAIDSNTGCRSTSDIMDGSSALKSVSVYPNPVVRSQPVEIQLPTTASDTKVRLFDASGNLKVEESISGVDHYSFDKTNFVSGVYIMEIVEAEEKTIVKLIIE
jgi:predicted outer membrane repeat protein